MWVDGLCVEGFTSDFSLSFCPTHANKEKHSPLSDVARYPSLLARVTGGAQFADHCGSFHKKWTPNAPGSKAKNETHRRRENSTAIKRGSPPIYLALLLIDDVLCCKVEGIIKSSRLNVRIAWKGGPNLRQKLVRSAYLPPPCPEGGRL